MSARLSPIERDARRIASDALQGTRRRRKRDQSAWEVLEDAVQICERFTAYAVRADDLPRARRAARAAQLLDEAQIRLVARQRRDTARVLEQAGIVPNARVVVVKTGYGATAAPTGTVLTLEDTADTYYLWGTDDDGHRWMAHYRDLEVVPDAPAVDAEPEGAEVFECDRDGCDYAIGAVGVPAFDDDPDVFNDEIREHIRGHQRDDAAAATYGLVLANAVIDARSQGPA